MQNATRVVDYIAKYGQISLQDSEKEWTFGCDGISKIGGRFKVRDLKTKGMF